MSNRNTGEKTELFYAFLPVLTIIVFLSVWETVVRLGFVSPQKLPTPTNVLRAFMFKMANKGPDGATLPTNILASLQVVLSGLTIAICIGTPLGLLMGWYRALDKFFRPVFEVIRPISPVAWIPLIIIWVGIGLNAKAVIIFLSAFVPCVINSYTGIRQTSAVHINVAKTFGASNFYTFLHVGIPSAVPMIFAGMRIALANSWGTLVAAEMLAASAGLGYMLNMARNFIRIDIVVLGMICIGLLGYIFTWAFGKLERIIIRGRTV